MGVQSEDWRRWIRKTIQSKTCSTKLYTTGKDFDESFCPIVRLESLRMLIAKSLYHGLQFYQLYVAMAFLNETPG